MNGNWGGWGSWGSCIKSCVSGIKSWFCFCNNLVLFGGGLYCFGFFLSFIFCNIYNCLSKFFSLLFIKKINILIFFYLLY